MKKDYEKMWRNLKAKILKELENGDRSNVFLGWVMDCMDEAENTTDKEAE